MMVIDKKKYYYPKSFTKAQALEAARLDKLQEEIDGMLERAMLESTTAEEATTLAMKASSLQTRYNSAMAWLSIYRKGI